MSTYACGLDPKAKFKALCSSAFERDKEFSIGIDNLEIMFERNNGHCTYTGVKFVNEVNHNHAPSVDRINPSVGYVPGNMLLCTRAANNIKEYYFEKFESVTYIKQADIDIAFQIYKKLTTVEKLSDLSLNAGDEVPDINISKLLNRFIEKAQISITMGFKVPDELRTICRNYVPVKEKLVHVYSTPKTSTIARYGDITKFTSSSNKNSTKTQETNSSMPADYDIAKKYIKYCDTVKNELSFVEFLAKSTQKICDFSLQEIENREFFIIDDSKSVTADNILVLDKKYLKVLNAMKESSISFEQFKNYLTNICKVINKD